MGERVLARKHASRDASGGRERVSGAVTTDELAYAEAVRAIDTQARTVEEVRARTGVLLTGASIVASFLGSEALRGSDLDLLSGLALLAFGGVVASALAILWPREWRFALGATVLLEDWVDQERQGGVVAMRRFVAERIDQNWLANKKKLDSMFALFEVAAVALGAEVILWTIKIA